MKEEKASEIVGEAVGVSNDKKNMGDFTVTDVNASTETVATTSSAAAQLSSAEGYSSNGGPKVAAALLSLGQDLTKGQAATVAVASAAALVPGAGPGEDQQQQQQNVQNPSPLELVATSEIPMLPTDIGTKANGTATTTAINNDTNKNSNNNTNTSKKRKLNKPKANKNDSGNPPDLLHWLSSGELVGDWDVLCGRGGESNNFIGNKRYRKVVGERKAEYRKINVKQRKMKTNFVRDIVSHIKNCGGRFIDIESQGRYYVVTEEKARKKTSQALRETKELKWLDADDQKSKDNKKKTNISNKDVVCLFCKKSGHKTRIAKACLMHYEWLDATTKTADSDTTSKIDLLPTTTATTNRPTSVVVDQVDVINKSHVVNGGTLGIGGITAAAAAATTLPLQPPLQNKSVTVSLSLPNTGTNANTNTNTTTNVGLGIANQVSV